MDRWTSESHMDFEYQNKTGPVDSTSPWLQHSLPSGRPTTNSLAKKRLYSEYRSPEKEVTSPSVISGDLSSFSAMRFPPSTPKDYAWAPRNIDTGYASSGPDNNSSPENNADSEATPDLSSQKHLAASQKAFAGVFDENATKKTNFSFKQNFGSTKGGLAKGRPNGVIKRIRQDRRRENDRRSGRHRDNSVSDFEIEKDSAYLGQQASLKKISDSGLAAQLFHLVESHPHVPHILSWYAQLFLNVSLIASVLYLLYTFWATVRSDVDKQSEEAFINTLAEIAKCASDYRDNRCEKESRAPALEMACDSWERCKNRDAKSIGRAKISAHAFAEIYNSFIEPLSYKTMIFTMVFVVGLIVSANLALGFTRSRVHSNYDHIHSTHGQGTYFSPDATANLHWQPRRFLDPEQKKVDFADAAASKTPIRRLQYG